MINHVASFVSRKYQAFWHPICPSPRGTRVKMVRRRKSRKEDGEHSGLVACSFFPWSHCPQWILEDLLKCTGVDVGRMDWVLHLNAAKPCSRNHTHGSVFLTFKSVVYECVQSHIQVILMWFRAHSVPPRCLAQACWKIWIFWQRRRMKKWTKLPMLTSLKGTGSWINRFFAMRSSPNFIRLVLQCRHLDQICWMVKLLKRLSGRCQGWSWKKC